MSKAEFDQFAADYQRIHQRNVALSGEEPAYFAAYKMRDFTRLLRERGVTADARLLDFGSGVGASVAPLLALLPKSRLVCADVSAGSLDVSRSRHGDRCDYLLLDGSTIDLPDHSIDGAFACCVFHHIPEAAHGACLRELRRVLKPGAPWMVYEHNPLNPLTVHAVRTCPLDDNAVLIGARTMRQRCAEAGFGALRIDYRVFFPAPLRALRPLEDRLKWLPLGAQYSVSGTA